MITNPKAFNIQDCDKSKVIELIKEYIKDFTEHKDGTKSPDNTAKRQQL